MTDKQVEYFTIKEKADIVETILWGLESVIYIIGAFFTGFQFRATGNLLYFAMFILIIIIRFVWKKVEKVTKKVAI